jgi:flagellar secretion chaperone FliS
VQTNPYQRYAEANLLSNNPLELVVALYRGALDSVLAACRYNEMQDHSGRGRAINKALDILAELTFSLDGSAGGAIAIQLHVLYAYMREKLVEGHAETSQAKLMEVAGLLRTLLEGWQQIAAAGARDAGYGLADGAAGPLTSPLVSPGVTPPAFEYARL